MADYSYISYIDYDRNGNSANFSDEGNFTDSSGTLNDGETDTTFEGGDTFTSGQTGTFLGTYTDAGGNVYVVVETGANTWRVYSKQNAADTEASIDAQISEGDLNTSVFTTCFLKGALILTDIGEVLVEDLKIGDTVVTGDGQVVPVRWIGRQTVDTRFGPAERLRPVRICKGALGEDAPHTDLLVTADHAILLQNVLCHAGALVNEVDIQAVPLSEFAETYEVFSIETNAHEILFANGTRVESFIDNVSRQVFDNYSEYETLYGDNPDMQELSYPRAQSARQVPQHIRALVNREDRAA